MSKQAKMIEIDLKDGNGTIITTWSELAQIAGLSVKQFKRHIQELQKHGFIDLSEI